MSALGMRGQAMASCPWPLTAWPETRLSCSAKLASTTGESLGETEKASPYTLVNLGASWQVNDRVRLSGGVTNLQDRRILRTNTSEGTATFNEAEFRYALNDDAMASDKLAEGIRAFAADAARLDAMIEALRK